MNQLYKTLFCFLLLFGCKEKNNTSNSVSEGLQRDSITEITLSPGEKMEDNCSLEKLFSSIEKNKTHFEKKISNEKNSKKLDSLYVELSSIITPLIDSINAAEKEFDIDTLTKHKHQLADFSEQIEQLNLKLKTDTYNGNVLYIQKEFYQSIFNKKITKNSQELAELEEKTAYILLNSEVILDDISPLLLKWENYILKNKESILSTYAFENQYKKLIKVYLFGKENKRTFDPSAKKFNEHFEKNYITFIKKNPDTKTAHITKVFLKYFYEYTEKSNAKSFFKTLYNTTNETIETSFRQ